MLKILTLLICCTRCLAQSDTLNFADSTDMRFHINHEAKEQVFKIYSVTRASDFKDLNDTTFEIISYGDGWVDRDSLPIGKWKFYSFDGNGKEYLFKEGNYKRTTPESFEPIESDFDQIYKIFNYSIYELYDKEATRLQFVKCGLWTYYHANGIIWKKVQYLGGSLPLSFGVSNDGNGSYSLTSSLNQNYEEDEFVDTSIPLFEYDDTGRVFKKVVFRIFNGINYKAIFDVHGKILKEFQDYERQTPIMLNSY